MVRRFLLVVGVVFSLVACSGGSSGSPEASPTDLAVSPTEAPFVWHPTGIAIAKDGTVYVSGCADHEVFRIVAPDGTIDLFAPTPA